MAAGIRLSQEAVRIIREVTAEVFGPEAEVFLFGSRADPSAKGGDIDLLVEVPRLPEDWPLRKTLFRAKLKLRLGDQKIDVLVHSRREPKGDFAQRIRLEAVKL